MDIKRELAEFMIKSNAIRFGLFKLSSGKESPYYIDLRVLPSFPSYFKLVIDAFKTELNKLNTDYLCSIPTAGLVYTSALSYILAKPLIYVRKEPKMHGTNKLIEGYLKPGAEVTVIDDVITTGRSVINAIEAIRANGGIVNNAIVLIDRLEGAKETLNRLGVNLIAIATIKEIAEILYNTDMIDEDTFTIIKEQVG
ncbi:MAG: orotate phosphoribosyltransferase [Candidatus Nitrosocaldaceae archaeon]|nr:MAG: orotate phosphoribosyltransferase [Candidatus Nitrosocaldaceae archaeon]